MQSPAYRVHSSSFAHTLVIRSLRSAPFIALMFLRAALVAFAALQLPYFALATLIQLDDLDARITWSPQAKQPGAACSEKPNNNVCTGFWWSVLRCARGVAVRSLTASVPPPPQVGDSDQLPCRWFSPDLGPRHEHVLHLQWYVQPMLPCGR